MPLYESAPNHRYHDTSRLQHSQFGPESALKYKTRILSKLWEGIGA